MDEHDVNLVIKLLAKWLASLLRQA